MRPRYTDPLDDPLYDPEDLLDEQDESFGRYTFDPLDPYADEDEDDE